jgi:hypothetical protein
VLCICFLRCKDVVWVEEGGRGWEGFTGTACASECFPRYLRRVQHTCLVDVRILAGDSHRKNREMQL